MAIVTNGSTNAVNKNMILPQVYAQLIREKMGNRVAITQFADIKGELMGKPGETLVMPAYQYIGMASDIKPGEVMKASNMKQSSKTAIIKMIAAPGIKCNDYDDAVEFGNAIDEAASQQARSIADKVDADLVAEVYKAPLKKALAIDGEITFAELNGMIGQFGEDSNIEDMSCILVHSIYVPSFLEMKGFVDITQTFNAQANGIQTNNCIGTFRGIPVVVSDRLINTTGALTEHFVLVIKKHSIAIVPKSVPFSEIARDASTRTNTIYTSYYFAGCVTDDAGIVLGKKTLPTA